MLQHKLETTIGNSAAALSNGTFDVPGAAQQNRVVPLRKTETDKTEVEKSPAANP